MCISMTVYVEYVRIHQFVWARVLCGTRYYQSASLDCSGTIQNIHMREIRRVQGSGMMMKMTDFMIRGRQTRPNGRLRSKFAALTRNGAPRASGLEGREPARCAAIARQF